MPQGYRTAAMVILVGVVLHVIAVAFGGGVPMIVGAVVWLVVATGLNRGMRWVAYLGFVLALVGISAALATLNGSSVPQWVMFGIVAVDIVVAVMLFRVLWRPRQIA